MILGLSGLVPVDLFFTVDCEISPFSCFLLEKDHTISTHVRVCNVSNVAVIHC